MKKMADTDSPKTRHVSRATLAMQLEAALRADILSGELVPGQRLRAAEIAPRYGVSATPLREAFQRLAVEGLVILDPRLGAAVSQLSRDDLRDVYDVRAVLESEALRRSMAAGDDEWLASVRIALDDLRSITSARSRGGILGGREASSATAWSAAHRAFDRSLYGASKSTWLLRFIDTMSERCERYRLAASELKDVDTTWLAEHEAIFAAVEAGDQDAAVSALRQHLADSALLLEQQLSGAI